MTSIHEGYNVSKEIRLDSIEDPGMTTIHVQRIGDKALVPHRELERLVELAKRQEDIALEIEEDDVSTFALMRLADQGGAFDFWHEEAEDVYSAEDGEAV